MDSEQNETKTLNKKEVHKKALGKLRYLRSKTRKKNALDTISATLHKFIKDFYETEHEHTREELIKHFSKKRVKNKEELLRLIDKLERLKYKTDVVSVDEVKELLNAITDHIKQIEVYKNEKETSFFEKIKKIFKKQK